MIRAKSSVTVFLFCLPFIFVLTQMMGQANFRYLNKQDGLSQVSIFSISQDSTGFLWFGTRDGLNKYDGNRFRVYRSGADQQGLVGNDIRTLYTDPLTKALWIGTLSGLSRYDAALDRFINYQNDGTRHSLWDDVVLTIYRDKSAQLWVGTNAGLNRYNPQTDKFDQVDLEGGQASPNRIEVTFITEHPAGGLYAGTENGLFSLSDQPDAVWEAVPQFIGQYFTCGQFDGADNLWLGTERSGVIRWNVTTDRKTTFTHRPAQAGTLSNDRVRTLVLNGKGDLWVGTFDGLNLLPKGAEGFIHYSDNSKGEGPLLHNSVRSLLIDRSDMLWVGTYYGGIHHFDERYNYFVNYQSDPYRNSLSANVVGSFAQDANGDLWVGTEGGGLNYLRQSDGVFSSYQWKVGNDFALPADNIKALLMDEAVLWVGTYRAGLTRFNPVTKQKKHFGTDSADGPVLSSDDVYGLLRHDDWLWVLTYGGGLNLINLTTDEIRYFKQDGPGDNRISSNNTRTILKRQVGGYWIGTDSGLNRVAVDDEGMPVSFTASLLSEKIYALAPAEKGVWVGTFSDGLLRCDEQGAVIRRYTTSDGLPDNSIFGILETAQGVLWLSTGNGLSRFDPEKEVFNNFNETNGLENLEFNFNAAFQTREGDLLFGGINGFTRFDPTAFSPNLNIAPVVFTRLLRNNQEVEIGGASGLLTKSINATTELAFSYDEADFTIEFAALDYFSPRNNHYAYMLEGLDRDWIFANGKTQASYTIQREGTYNFLLRGGNSDGVWNPEQRRITITVLPPPWRSWWAYLLYFLLTGLTVFALIWFLRLRHKVQLQEVAKQQQDELMEMKLRFFTNITHEFRTPLTLILGPLQEVIRKTDPQAGVGRQLGLINRNAQRLLNLVNQVLTFRKLATDHEPMQVVKCTLNTFITDIYESFQGVAELRGINYPLIDESGGVEVWLDRSKLEKVFFNLLSNAFKFTPDGGEIKVFIHHDQERVIVRIKDNGVGIPKELHDEVFKRFYEKSAGKQSHIKSSGIGLAVSRQMVELHGGDIYIEDNQNQGAEFVVALQLGREHFSEVVTGFAVPSTVSPETIVGQLVDATDYFYEAPEPLNGQTILVVDDNAEVRGYVADIFAADYQVLTATTGKEGLAVARAEHPDLVISDVMMPEMDGMAFCHALKNDLEISHIPMILLTARSGQPFRIQGLQTGADDYLTKPFNPEELKLRVANILGNRQRFKDAFGATLTVAPSKMEVTSLDEQFLRQVLDIAEQNVHDSGYKVEAFARDLAVSRTLLFNKLKALTGQTPSKFLKTFRMKRAAQLLEDSDYRVVKIATMVGFRDERYFSDCFKKEFGVAPGKYRKRKS